MVLINLCLDITWKSKHCGHNFKYNTTMLYRGLRQFVETYCYQLCEALYDVGVDNM